MPRATHADRGKHLCHYCNERPGITTDHIVPRAFGGPDAVWNYVSSCPTCNLEKGPSWPTCDCSHCTAAVDRFLAEPNRREKALTRLTSQADEMTSGIDALYERARLLRRNRTRLYELYGVIVNWTPTVDPLADKLIIDEKTL